MLSFLWSLYQRGRIYLHSYASIGYQIHVSSEQHIPMLWGNEAYFSSSNPTLSFHWSPLSIVRRNCSRIGRTVGTTCPKRQNLIIAVAKNAYLLYIYWRVATIENDTMARKRRHHVYAMIYRCFGACKCSSIQDIMECMSKTACTSSRTIVTDNAIYLCRSGPNTRNLHSQSIQCIHRWSSRSGLSVKCLQLAILVEFHCESAIRQPPASAMNTWF